MTHTQEELVKRLRAFSLAHGGEPAIDKIADDLERLACHPAIEAEELVKRLGRMARCIERLAAEHLGDGIRDKTMNDAINALAKRDDFLDEVRMHGTVLEIFGYRFYGLKATALAITIATAAICFAWCFVFLALYVQAAKP